MLFFKFLGTQINIKSSRLDYCMHTSYTNRGGKFECLGEKLGCLGGKLPPCPPHWIEPCQGTNRSSRARPASSASSASSGSSSKHVKCIGRYVLTGSTLGKGNFARVEAAVHTLTRSKVGEMYLWGE